MDTHSTSPPIEHVSDAAVAPPSQSAARRPRFLLHTLQGKTILIVVTTLLGLLLVLYLPMRYVLLASFQDVEAQQMQINVERTERGLDSVLSVLVEIVGGFSFWDDTYAFMDDHNQAFSDTAFSDSLIASNLLNVILVVDPSGTVVFSKAYDLESLQVVALPASLGRFVPNDPLLLHEDANSVHTGVLVLPKGPLLLAARPIVRTDGSGPIRGTIIFGRYLGEVEVAQLAETVQLPLTVQLLDRSPLPADVQAVRDVLRPGTPTVRVIDEQTIAGYLMLDDRDARHTVVLRVTAERTLYAQGQRWTSYFAVALVVVGIVFGLLILGLLRWAVLDRVAHLATVVQQIGRSRDLARRVQVAGTDELAELGGTINMMLMEITQGQQEQRDAALLREQVRLQAEALRAKRAFLSIVSHELRTPLTPILGYSDLLLIGAGGPLTDAQSDMLRRIQTNTRYLTALVDDVLVIGRLEAQQLPLQLTPIDLRLLIGEVLESLQTTYVAKQLAMRQQIATTLPLIEGDALRLQQIITNLLSNAIKYTPAHGTITISLFAEASGGVIEITDTGVGLTDEQLMQLFTPFYRADTAIQEQIPGTGLGLAIVKAFVDLHHGTVSVCSQPGVGSTFRVALPYTQPPVSSLPDGS